MSLEPRDPADLEQALLEHYRRHSEQEPSSALDARILAAAAAHQQASARAVEKAPLLGRLHGWLFGGSQRARWSMAFASLATLGIGVSLAMRTQERAPQMQYDAAPLSLSVPAPAPAPAMAPPAESVEPNAGYNAEPTADAVEARKALKKAAPQQRMAEQYEAKAKQPAAVGSLAEQASKPEAPAAPVVSAPLAKKAPQPKLEEAQLQHDLQQVLQLERSGNRALAEEQLHTLQQLHPERDLGIELQRLREARGQQ